MAKMRFYSTVILAVVVIVLAGCEKKGDEAYPSARTRLTYIASARLEGMDALSASDFAQQKSTVLADLDRSLLELDARIEALLKAANESTPAGRIHAALAGLRDRRTELEIALNRMREADGNTWSERQRDFQVAFLNLVNSLDQTEELVKR